MVSGMPKDSPAKHPAEVAKLKAERGALEALARVRGVEADVMEREKDVMDAQPHEARIFTFNDRVSAVSVAQCIHEVGVWTRRDDARPIEIVFNSPGGSVFEGLALFDFIRTVRSGGTRVDTTAIGMAASMGGVLLQAGEVRTMSSHSYLMIHEVASGSIGKVSEMEDELKLANRLQTRLVEILAERSSMNASGIRRKWKKTDWWLDAAEAFELGFVDRVV